MSEVIVRNDVVDIRSNVREKIALMEQYNKDLAGPIMREALRAALEMVGQRSAADYFITTGSAQEGAKAKTDPARLTMRTGRLIASLVGAYRFSSSVLPREVEKFVKTDIKSSTGGFEGGKKESIREVSVSGGRIQAAIGTTVPYAAAHELGSKHSVQITDKSRRFFWAMWFNTGDEMWMRMALTKKNAFNVTIPARPFLGPAARDSVSDIDAMLKVAVEESFKDRRV